jgi:hypothetical protein
MIREKRLETTIEHASTLIAKIESGFAWRTWLLAGAGVVFMSVAIALIAGGVYLHAEWNPASLPSYWRIFGITSIIAIPIFFILARIAQGSIVEEYAEHTDGLPGFIQGRAALGVMMLDACLWGPTMCLNAWKRIMQITQFATADRMLAAKLVAALFINGDGMNAADLILIASAPEQFSSTLAYLVSHEWIGIAKDGTRIWLASDRQQALQEAANS